MNKYQKEVEKMLNKLTKAAQKQLVSLYAASLIEIKEALHDYMIKSNYKELTVLEKIEVNRFSSLSVKIEEELNKLGKLQEDVILEHLRTTGHISYSELFYQFENDTGLRATYAALDKDKLEAIIKLPVDKMTLSERLNDGVIAEFKANLQSELFLGISKGLGYKQMAAKLSEKANSSTKRAMRILITEGGRVNSVARQTSQEEARSIGITFKKQWVSTLDFNTRDTHRNLDGQKVDVDDYFTTIDGNKAKQPHMFGIAKEDINCRCRTISVIDGYEAAIRRDNVTHDVIKYKNYNDWYKESYMKKPEYKAMGLI